MADLAITKNYADGSALTKALLDAAYDSVSTYINARNQGTAWDLLSVTGAAVLSSTLAVTGAITATGGIISLFGYRRPNLVYSSATAVNVEANTGTANQTKIVFPDGTVRSVTEDVSSTHKYRQFLITATAEFTSGTEDSGLYTGVVEANNTWYAVYAVKSAINSSNFVLVGTTTLPLIANFATLNTNFGTNGWVYLGLIKNGDNNDTASSILAFVQSGPEYVFVNPNTDMSQAVPGPTLMLATTPGTTTSTWTYSAGTGAADIPDHIAIVDLSVNFARNTSGDASYVIRNAADTITYGQVNWAEPTGNENWLSRLHRIQASGGIKVTTDASGSRCIQLAGFFDPLLTGPFNVI